MSPVAQLAYAIQSLGNSADDKQKSKEELYQQSLQFAERGEKEALLALKEYWQRTGNWEKGSKKQTKKVETVEKHLQM